MIQRKMEDEVVVSHLGKIRKDGILTFLLNNGTIRGALLHGTTMVNNMRVNHKLGILETLILGQSYIGGGLLTSMVKGSDRIALSIECAGPIKGLSVEADADGKVRGYLLANPVPVTEKLESFNLSPFFGPGFLSVTKYLESSKHPFTGKVMLRYGDIAKDLANYFLESEQIPTSVSLSVYFDKGGRVLGAGGLFLQALPGAGEDTLEALEERIVQMPSIGKYFSKGGDFKTLLDESLNKFSPRVIGEKDVSFYCSCSKERFSSFLGSMGKSEREDILRNGPFPLVTTCRNCSSSYSFSREEIQAIFSQ